MITCFMINIMNVIVFIVNIAVFFSEFVTIPIVFLKLITAVMLLLPFFVLQVPEDLKILSIPSLMLFNGVVFYHATYNYYRAAETGKTTMKLWDTNKAISMFTVASF